MPTERIDIVVTERGSRTVKRNIDELASSADRAGSEMDQLRAALRSISPTSQLSRALEQINALKAALAAPRSQAVWLNTPIAEANAAIVQVVRNLRSARAEMGGNVEWAAVTEFRQAEAELDDIITKLQRVRTMQQQFVNTYNVRDRTTGTAPYLPQVVTLPEANRFIRDADAAARNAERLGSGIDRVSNAAGGAHVPFMLLNRYVGAFGSLIIANRLMEFADAATVVRNRVDTVSESVGEAQTAMSELYTIARRTRSPIEQLSTLYQKGMMAAGELGVSQQKVLRFVEAVGMGLAVQGSSAQTARGALIQLSQAIGTDIVRAEEFNSILEGAYLIALAAARGIDETGGSVARLRRMVIDGQITSEQFFNAIMSQYPEIAEMFAQTNPTISQAFTVLRNKMIEYISKSEEARAISALLADAILLIADNIEPLADLLFSLGIAWGVAFTAGKIAAVGRMATNVGLLGTAAAGLRTALGFMGGPIVGGLALLAGAAFWVYQNTENAADQIRNLRNAMDEGVTALTTYNEHVQAAEREQRELGGVINLTTEALLRQSRAQLQEALRNLQTEIATIQDNLAGDSWNPLDTDNIRAALAELAGPGFNFGVIGYGNAELENLYNLLKAIEDGTGDISAFTAAVERLRGVGPEVQRATEDLATAMAALPEDPGAEPSAQAQLWLQQAEEQLRNIAEAIGGFDAQIQAAADANNLPDKIEALQALQAALEAAAQASSFVNNSSWVTETADLLRALDEARQQEALMLEALGANAQRLQELTSEAERFRAPMEGASDAAEETEAALDRINFVPLQQGARGFADELIRAAAAVEVIRNRGDSVPVLNGQPQIVNAAYTPGGSTAFAASGSSGGLDDATYGAMLMALAEYGVPTLNADTQSRLWMSQAVEQLTLLAGLIGGFDQEVAALEDFDPVNFDQVRLADELAGKLQEALNVAEALWNNSSITETLAMLEALNNAREQERLMLEALDANAQRMNELVSEAERLRQPMQGSANAAEETEAALDRINFVPLQQGARGFADELIRAAAAVEVIRDRGNSVPVPSGQPQIINAAYTPGGSMAFAASGSSGGLDDATYGAMLMALAEYGVPTLNATLSTMGSGPANSNFRPGMGADTNIVTASDRTGQSEEYLSVLQSINQELDARYSQMILNNEALEQERMLYDVLQRARQEDVVLDQQDVAMIRERIEALTELERKINLINDVGDAVFNNLESALNNFVQTGMFNFSEFAKSVIADLAKIAIQMMIIAPLKNFFGGILGGLTGVSAAALPGHNEGADFIVGGTGGVDKNVVAFRASRGERVQVTPAGKSGNNDNMTINFNITTPDVEGFRRSESQMAARAQRMLARGQRNS